MFQAKNQVGNWKLRTHQLGDMDKERNEMLGREIKIFIILCVEIE